MRERGMVGTRIRQRRRVLGVKQAELAKQAGISASYLNLIEHNRRRIGGKTLLHLAEALQTEPTALSMGADSAVLAALESASELQLASGQDAPKAEFERVEEFAGRFPGWAGLLVDLDAKRIELEHLVTILTERLANDPRLAEALHEVISTVTSIRSAASILADTRDLEPEWQMRFHRNLNEDSARLATGAEALVRYLEDPPEKSAHIVAPADEVERFVEAHGFHFPELEGEGAPAMIDSIIAASDAVETEEALHIAQNLLQTFARDAHAMPLASLKAAIRRHGLVPDALVRDLGQPLARVLRRLALLPSDLVGPAGFVSMDNAGRILIRKPVLGFLPPRSGISCALWPLYEGLAAPERPIQTRLRHDQIRLRAYAVSEQITPSGFDTPGLRRAYMLLLPEEDAPSVISPDVACGICGQTSCAAAP